MEEEEGSTPMTTTSRSPRETPSARALNNNGASQQRERERKFWDKRVGQLYVRRDFIAAGDKKIANVATRG